MNFEQTIGDTVAKNLSIDYLDELKCIRSTFKSNLATRVNTISKFQEVADPILSLVPPTRDIYELCKRAVDERYRVLVTDNLSLPYIFKYKGKVVKPLYSYAPVHIKSSLIRTVLLDGEGTMEKRINRMIYILYSYWFYHKDNMKDITHNVCIDIENVIATIIDKGLTTYKNYTITGDVVEELRYRLTNERLMAMGDL